MENECRKVVRGLIINVQITKKCSCCVTGNRQLTEILNKKVITKEKRALVSRTMAKSFEEFNFFIKEYDDFLPHK